MTYSVTVVDLVPANVAELVKLVGKSADFVNTGFVGSEVTLEGFVLLLQGNDFSQTTRAIVVSGEHGILVGSP